MLALDPTCTSTGWAAERLQKKRVTIGRHGSPWTPETARAEAKRLALMVGQGSDPIEHERQRKQESVNLAFDSYTTKFVTDHLKNRWKDWRAGERALLREAVPILGKRALPSIKRKDITAVLDKMSTRPASARIAHATLRSLFKWAENRGDIERSPIEGMEPPVGPASRERTLSDHELEVIWKSLDDLGFPFGPLIKLLIVTGQRREEVSGVGWEELNRLEAIWVLPAIRTKNGLPHLVPLSSLAVAILDDLAGITETDVESGKSLWPSKGLALSTTGATPPSGYSKAKSRLDSLIERRLLNRSRHEPDSIIAIPAWRVHDIRRTVATGLQRIGVRFEVTEAILNHVSGSRSGVAGIYQRHDWKDEKREALKAWAEHIYLLTGQQKKG